MFKVLITGGAGFIGSHTIIELLTAGHNVAVIDNLSNGSMRALERVKQLTKRDFTFVNGDIRDQPIIDALMAKFCPDAVVHFAGLKAVNESIEKPLDYYDTNVSGTICLLKAMKAVACHKIVFSSSATVYGDPQYLPYDESHPTAPVNPYGRSKLIVEQILGDWCAESPLRSAISLRYFNPVGAHQSGRIGEAPQGTPNNLMPFLAQVAAGRRPVLQIFGDDYDTRDGTGERDYVHVVDLAKAHVLALDVLDGSVGHEAINLGTGYGVTVLELVDAFEEASGAPVKTVVASRRTGDLERSFAKTDLAQARLGWTAELGITEMCRDTWAWHSDNPRGFGTQDEGVADA